MSDDIKWFFLRKKNSFLVLGRIWSTTLPNSPSRHILELVEPTIPGGTRFRGVIGCFEEEMKLEYAEEIEKFDLEVVEMKD